MKRRDAAKTLFLFSLGSAMLYSCSNPYQAVQNLGLTQLNFKNKHLKYIDEINKIILPIHEVEALNNHTTLPFVMKSINDLYKASKRALIENVYINWESYFEQLTDTSWANADKNSKRDFITSVLSFEQVDHMKAQSTKEKLAYFINVLKEENKIYISTCEFILRNKRAYEMAPGRYNGSYPLKKLQMQ